MASSMIIIGLYRTPGGGRGIPIFSYIRRLRPFFGFNILNFNIFGVFRKMNIFGGMKFVWIFLGIITKLAGF